MNATKYRLPSEEQFRSWAAQVPEGFRFAVKAPDGVERRLATFEERVRALGDRLGCVRIVVERPRDDGFLELLLGSVDPEIRYALDLRDPTWDGVEDRLAQAGAVRVGDATGRAGWAYLRYRELRYGDARARDDRRRPRALSTASASPTSGTATSPMLRRRRCASPRCTVRRSATLSFSIGKSARIFSTAKAEGERGLSAVGVAFMAGGWYARARSLQARV